MIDTRPYWSVSVSYRGKGGHEGVQTFVVQADGRLGAVRTAWTEAKTSQAAAHRKSARLVPHSVRVKRLPPQE